MSLAEDYLTILGMQVMCRYQTIRKVLGSNSDNTGGKLNRSVGHTLNKLSFRLVYSCILTSHRRQVSCILATDFTTFYDRMTVHRNRFLVNKTNRCTEFQFYWYYYSTCFGQPFCPSSGVLSRISALVHFTQL